MLFSLYFVLPPLFLTFMSSTTKTAISHNNSP